MIDIHQLVQVTLFFEDSGRADGAYHNDPNDPGGETKYGISKRYHQHVDIANLTEAGAISIYNTEYYATTGIVRLTDLVSSAKLFDMAVNFGQATAIRIFKQCINQLYGFNKVYVNGIVGTADAVVVNAFTAAQHTELVNALRVASNKRHAGLIMINQKLSENSAGWKRRDYWPYNQPGRTWPFLPVGDESWPATAITTT